MFINFFHGLLMLEGLAGLSRNQGMPECCFFFWYLEKQATPWCHREQWQCEVQSGDSVIGYSISVDLSPSLRERCMYAHVHAYIHTHADSNLPYWQSLHVWCHREQCQCEVILIKWQWQVIFSVAPQGETWCACTHTYHSNIPHGCYILH